METVVSLYKFLVQVFETTPLAGIMLASYPIGMFIGIYWTQGLKRNQYRRLVQAIRYAKDNNVPLQMGKIHRYTSFELRGISSLISGTVIGLMAKAFFELPNDKILAHMVIGGAAAPALFWLIMIIAKWKFPSLARKLRVGDRRKKSGSPPPNAGGERRCEPPLDFDQSGQFWSNHDGEGGGNGSSSDS